MRNPKRFFLCVASCAILLAGIDAHAIPARPGAFEMSQPDGSKITVTLHGDEYFHYYLTSDGFPLLPDKDGYLCYMTAENGQFAVSSVRAHDNAVRAISETSFIKNIDPEVVLNTLLSKREDITRQRRGPAKAGSFSDLMTDYPTIGSPKALVLLVEFQDIRFKTQNPLEEFTKLMTQEGYNYNGATGSALDYFVENSGGKFTPDFQVYGPVTLPENSAYYGAPTANLYDCNPYEMVAKGCQILDETTDIDFSQFDNDGDGWVDNVFIFYAGYGQNSGADVNTIWPHAANIYTYGNIRLTLDGVQIGNYACTNELQGNSGEVRTGIGTFCHEFSHVLGLPDLYPTNNTAGFTPGPFELMDTGPYNNNNNTPPYMSAYDRISLRWLNPRELTGPETVVLNDITSNEAYLINTIMENEYYLFENRQQKGWDAYIPGHGMLVWHIDYDATIWSNNQVNNTPAHQRVDIVEADNLPTTDTRNGDPFPGVNNVTNFTDETTPAMSTWTNVKIGLPITDILEQDGVISFKVAGGGDRIESVTALNATNITPVSFQANWEGRVTINKYEIDLLKKEEVVPEETFVKETKSTSDCYIEIEGLEPSTDYYYVVRAVDGNMRSSDSNAIEVRTEDPTFDMLQVTANEASGISAQSFTANWEPLEGTEYYELDVYTKNYVLPVYDVADFTNDLDLPDGWYTTCSTTSGVAGTFGEARPSLRMISNNDMLSTPVYTADINEFSFWYCGSKDIEGNLLIEALMDGSWTVFSTLPLGPTAQTATFTSESNPKINPGCRSFRMTFQRTNGSLYIDDVNVAYKGAALPVYAEGYEHLNVGTETSKVVENLFGDTNYYYTVTAYKGDLAAIVSNEISVVTTPGRTATLQAGAITIGKEGQNIIVHNNSNATADIEICNTNGIIVYKGTVGAAASSSIAVANRGVYIVKSGNAVQKIIL